VAMLNLIQYGIYAELFFSEKIFQYNYDIIVRKEKGKWRICEMEVLQFMMH
jgi:hypothetical protein